ncbi:hypothetical protein LDENG_00117490 [Lucifuga dentata]|nr:hypothetical protein LDENG_00117490 [Lucifuga dentata]
MKHPFSKSSLPGIRHRKHFSLAERRIPLWKMEDKELVWALKNGDLDEVKIKLVTAADVNRTLEGGRKALHYAVDFGHTQVVEFLIQKGADINAPDKHGLTPLLCACYEGQLACAKILLEKGADKEIKGPNGISAFEAAECEAIKALLVSN